MWNIIKSFIKRVFRIKSNDLKDVIGEAITSKKMETAIEGWLGVFYGEPPWKDPKVKLTNFAAITTSHAATLATNEIVLNTGTGRRAEYVKDQISRYVLSGIRNNVQLAASGGMAVLKPYVVGKNIYTDVVSIGNFVPLRISGGVFEAGCFIDSAEHDGKRYIRIENHDLQNGTLHITNQAFLEGAVRKGANVPLSFVPQWADLQPELSISGIEKPLYAVISMPFSNTVDPASRLPVSLYASAMQSLEEIDRIYTEFLWEVKTGKRRQIFDSAAIKAGSNMDKKALASDQYIVLEMGAKIEKPYDDYTPEMRIEAYQRAMDIQLRMLEGQCGLSAGTFTFDIRTGNAKTATEIISSDKTTYNTISAIQNGGMHQALLDLVYVYDTYTTLYKLAPKGKIDATVSFGDSVFEDTETEFKRRMQLAVAGFLNKDELISWYFGVSKKDALSMIPGEEKEEDDTEGEV